MGVTAGVLLRVVFPRTRSIQIGLLVPTSFVMTRSSLPCMLMGLFVQRFSPTELKLGFGSGFSKPPTSGNSLAVVPDIDLVNSIGSCFYLLSVISGSSFRLLFRGATSVLSSKGCSTCSSCTGSQMKTNRQDAKNLPPTDGQEIPWKTHSVR